MKKPVLSSTLWPVHLKPKDDELISSWLVRLAIAHGMKLHTFCSLTWPGKQIWNRDIDKSADAEVAQILAEKTGTSLERVCTTMLSAYENILYERHNHFGPTSWIMPVGIYHRRRRQFGLQFCPRCLAEDEEPYYRRRWRLAFVIVCERHHILLHDRCPKCEEPINFHRNEMGNYRKFVADSLTICHACRYDLKTIKSNVFVSATAEEARFTGILLSTINAGFIQISEGVVIYSHLFFVGLRQLMKILAMCDKRIVKLRKALSETYNIDVYGHSMPRTVDVQELGIGARRQLLGLARCLLEEWPHRFVEISRQFKVWSSLWLSHLESPVRGRVITPPFWFWSVIHDYLYRAKYCPSGDEIAFAIKYLTRNGKSVNQSILAKLLGVSVLRKSTKV